MTTRQENEITKFHDVISLARETNDKCVIHETMAYIINHVYMISNMDTQAGQAAKIMAKALARNGIRSLPLYAG